MSRNKDSFSKGQIISTMIILLLFFPFYMFMCDLLNAQSFLARVWSFPMSLVGYGAIILIPWICLMEYFEGK